MSPSHIGAAVLAAALAAFAFRKRAGWSTGLKVGAVLGVVALGVFASGALSGLPSFEEIVKHVAKALGKGTYALVGGMAFLETGAFVGFVAPGEFTVILGGVIAGEGTISILPLIGIVWICAIAGDSLSFLIGQRVGREFLLKHGPRIRITEERFHHVEDYFDHHGGKTIVIGRFIGFVRPLAPFIAGTSRMTYGRFLPYSVLGTGLWGSTFCLLGYIFWRSFSKVSKIAGRATLAIGVAAGLIAVGVYLYRRFRDPAERERLERRLKRRPVLWRAWRLVGRPFARITWPQIRFLWGRLTPGNLGIEFTTSLAVAAGGAYVFILYASAFDHHPLRHVAGDHTAFAIASDLRNNTAVDVAKLVTDLGAFPVVAALVLIASVLLASRRRPLELFALAGGFVLVIVAVHAAKAGIDRPRPSGSLVSTRDASYPSGHAAYSTVYVALSVVASRVFGGLASRAALVLAAVAVAALIAATRVYLRAHYLSDVLGGLGLGLAIMAGCGAVALVVGHIRQNGAASSPRS
jgi:undecaprenyl-diphosphatase